MNPFVLAAATFGDRLDSTFYGFDMAVFEFFGSIQSSFMTGVAKFITSIGDQRFVILVGVLALLLCLFKRTRKFGFSLLVAIAIGTVITNLILKPAVLRIRPYNTLQGNADYWSWYVGAGMLSESDYSFPSGHTTAAFELAAALWFCFWFGGKKKLSWVFPAVAFLVLCSRLYLMVHYATDVIAAVFVGVFAGTCGYGLSLLVCRIMEGSRLLDGIDAERLFKKKIDSRVGCALIAAAVVVIFCASYIPMLSEGGESAVRCAYDGEYDCQNEARVDDGDYPPIDGKYYCKIHWNQLSDGQ